MYLEQAALYSLLRCDLIFTSAPAAALQHSRPTWWAEQNTLYFIGTFSSCMDLYNPAYGTYWEWQTHIHIQDGGWVGGGGRCVYWRQQLRSISLFLVSLHLSLRRRCNHYGMPRNLRSHDWDNPLFSCSNPHFRRTIQNYILNEFICFHLHVCYLFSVSLISLCLLNQTGSNGCGLQITGGLNSKCLCNTTKVEQSY